MNFEKTRELKRKKRKKIYLILLGVAVIFAILIGIFCKFYPADTWKYYVKKPNVSKRRAGELRMHFLDVGQGDCTIVEFPDGKTMIIDGGDGSEQTAKIILRYANALKIKKFDFMVATHAHADHVGSLDVVLQQKGAKTIYYPDIDIGSYNVSLEYKEFYYALSKSTATKIVSEVGVHYAASGEYPYRFAFLSPHKAGNPNNQYDVVNNGNYSDEAMNDTSAVLLIEYQGRQALFCGDASVAVERSLVLSDSQDVWKVGALADLHLKADILKVAHHGSSDSTSEAFIERLGVKTAIISCGEENGYGHPHRETLERLQGVNVDVFRTDLHGNILITIDENGEYKVK